ncbi:lycopene cyclase family protein [Rhodohalobacter sp. 8-1]|uniref:lycopene cyclase family protein n=1 Tax=Rhodohalobacter sp. 8-1 TaxID=3131972 RepID=UPI0030EF94C7
MSESTSYDYIIAGAGAAGLSLVWNMMKSDLLNEKKILLIDQSLNPSNDKTWCFWDDSNIPDSDLIHHSWKTLEVRAFGNLYSEKLSHYSYHCLRSYDYTKTILEKAEKNSAVTLLETSIEDFSEIGDHGIVHTSNGDFSADWIFQSAIRPKSFYHQKVDVSLKQHFLGAEIETTKPAFDPEKVMLMDFDTSQKHGVTFFYILPYSENKALVEYTFFTDQILSEDEYQAGIEAHLSERYSLQPDDYKVARTETGAIPMEDRRYPAWYNSRVMNTGTVGGLTKPSTGYTFTRIQSHCHKIVSALEKNEIPPVSNKSPLRFRIYDIMLLYLLETEPEVCKKIFHDLFKRNSFDTILKFLEEDTHLGQELSIFASLPYIPFFKAIYKMKHRIITGA